MLGAPKVRAVRGFSDFGYSFIYVIFEDGTDIYWARTRTLEYLSGVLGRLPQDAKTELGPDATGLGWFTSTRWRTRRTAEPRRPALVPGLDAALLPQVGAGCRRGRVDRRLRAQYQVNVDPNKLRNYGISIQRVVEVVRGGNIEAGGA